MIRLRRCLFSGLFLTAAMLSARAGTFFSDFNTGDLPPGTHTNANNVGGAFLELTGGVNDSGCFKITKNINSQNGSLILDDLDGGNPIYGFDISFNVRIGGGTSTPADGFAFVVAPDITDTSLWGETGAGSGLRFAWCIYTGSTDSGGGLTLAHPSLTARAGSGGGLLTYHNMSVAQMETGGSDPSTWWSTAHIRLNPDGALTMDYKGNNIVSNYFIPGYQDLVNAGLPVRFGIAGRTGGLNENFWIDNLSITTYTNPMVGISQAPVSQTVQQGDNATFYVRVGNTTGVTYQWYSNSVPVAGATSDFLVVNNVQPATSGSQFTVAAIGPNNSVTSAPVVLTVTSLTLPATPQLSFNFDDGAVPAGTTVSGNAAVDTSGGVGNSGCLHLTDANNSESGVFVISDPNAGAPVYGFTARFKSLVGGGTIPPADGFAFAFGNDIPAAPSGNFENGVGLGTGLIVSFDIYDNVGILGALGAPGPEPSIALWYGGQKIAQTSKRPVSLMETGVNPDGTPAFDDTIIQLGTDGTVTVVYRGALVWDRLPIPRFASISGGSFALAARTGGLNENQWVDNLELTTTTTPGTVRIYSQSGNQTILVNHAMTNTVTVVDPTGVAYQWYRGTTAISGATDSAYVIPSVALTDSGAIFTAQATKSSVTATSAPVTLTVANITIPASPQFAFDFNDGQIPAGTELFPNDGTGAGYVTPDSGVNNSGCLHLTDAINSLNAAFVVTNLVFGGNQVNGISVSFDVREGGGSSTPADGWSFNWAADLADGLVPNAETGTGSGVSLAFRIYVGNGNADNPPSPYIGIKYKGAFIATTQIPAADLNTDAAGVPTYRTVLFRVDPDGKAYLAYGERVLYNGLQLPNFTFIPNSKFGIYGRTGGLNNNQWFDNVRIQASQNSAPMAIATQPADVLVMVGQTATFSVVANNPAGATYQWQKNGANISGATQSSYTTPATVLTDNGALFRCTATGPSGSATSANATLSVVAPIVVNNPVKVYTFDDCLQPPDTIITGSSPSSGYITCSGGVNDSGVLHLTDNVNSLDATFLMPDFNNNAPVKAIAVSMAVRIADGSGTPADGISFAWGSSNSIPDTINFGEGGAGDGVSVGLITYAGRADGPSFNVWYNGTRLVNKIVPYSALYTGDLSTDPTNQYATLVFRVNENGTLDMQYKGNAVFNALPIPGYTAIAGGRFAIGGRTGGENESQWIDNIQIATTTGVIPVPLGFTVSGTTLKLTWPAGFVLQSTSSLTPPVTWTDVPNAASPYTPPMTNPLEFYSLRPQ